MSILRAKTRRESTTRDRHYGHMKPEERHFERALSAGVRTTRSLLRPHGDGSGVRFTGSVSCEIRFRKWKSRVWLDAFGCVSHSHLYAEYADGVGSRGSSLKRCARFWVGVVGLPSCPSFLHIISVACIRLRPESLLDPFRAGGIRDGINQVSHHAPRIDTS